jgi:hypothetical protein
VYLESSSGRIDQAVIVEPFYFYALDEDLPALILTPTCDFAQQKCEYVQACAIVDAWEVVKGLLGTSWSKSGLVADGKLLAGPLPKNKRGDLTDKLTKLAAQQFPRYHWLAPLPGTQSPRIADFQLVQSVSLAEVESICAVVAELRSPFREEATARYSTYMARVGTDGHPPDELKAWIDAGLAALFPDPAGAQVTPTQSATAPTTL